VLPLRAKPLSGKLPQAAPTVNHMLPYGQAFDGLFLSSRTTHINSPKRPCRSLQQR